jgi:hypothetical protein
VLLQKAQQLCRASHDLLCQLLAGICVPYTQDHSSAMLCRNTHQQQQQACEQLMPRLTHGCGLPQGDRGVMPVDTVESTARRQCCCIAQWIAAVQLPTVHCCCWYCCAAHWCPCRLAAAAIVTSSCISCRSAAQRLPARYSAVTWPMPDVAPVTSATLPVRSTIESAKTSHTPSCLIENRSMQWHQLRCACCLPTPCTAEDGL